jgi:CDP-glucose 4,6-dehydratase
MNPDFWKGRRVFLTGHTGFKGSWLALWLQELGATTFGYSLPAPTKPSLFELGRVAQGTRSVEADVRSLDLLARQMRDFQPEVVFHLAAQSLVRPSYEDPVLTYSTNVMGTVNLLESVRHCDSIRAVVVVTSDKCYVNQERQKGYTEDEPMGGHDPYSSSKGCAELVTSAFRSSYFGARTGGSRAAIASARAGNVIGGGDWSPDRLIADIVSAFLDGRRAVIRNPGAIRPWQHVLESLSGYLLLAERLCEDADLYSEAWNFGADEEESHPVAWIADRMAEIWGQGSGWDAVREANAPHEARNLRLDSSKAKNQLGWSSRLDLARALEWTVDWYRAYAAGKDMRAESLMQIRRYQERVAV